ncbi:MAG TPA: hypothetical protein VLR52_05550, partial [Bacteroidales bacterium]|nr:hypothetical protein [Bacteroidales bacterium]
RSMLQKTYPDFKTYDKNFVADDAFLVDFFQLAEKQGVKINEKQYALSEKLIKNQLKALIAQKLWDVNAFFMVINQNDEEVQKAIEVINDDAIFRKMNLQY